MRVSNGNRTAGIAIVTIVVVAGACASQRRPVTTPGIAHPDHALAIERGRNIVRPLVRRGSGVAVAVGVDGQLVWSEGFGRSARDGGEPVRPDSPFRVYSLMKQVTAVLALQAAGRGEVRMGDPVRRVLPALPEHYGKVTLLHLLTHTAGVRHYRDASEAALTTHCASAVEALPLFIADPLVGAPGGEESYSTWGFVLASAVLETAADMPFDSLLAIRILQPAGMTSTRLDDMADPASRSAYYDVAADGAVSVSASIDNSCKMGGGGFVASAEDIVRFHNAVLDGRLVPLAAVRQMLAGRTTLEAGGSGPGGEALSHVDVDSRISVVVLSNTGGLEQRIALERARELLVGVFTDQSQITRPSGAL
jgi:CubicO group peptidase (beta-lactamase class C family)